MKKKGCRVPSWDDYFMGICFLVATRSRDPGGQYGSVIVTSRHKIIGYGFNDVSLSCHDQDVDWSRPNRYPFVLHAEDHGIENLTETPNDVNDCAIYTTGQPCYTCIRRIVGKRIRKVVYGPQTTMVNEDEWQHALELTRMNKLQIERYAGNLNWLRDRFDWMGENMGEVFQPQLPIPL